MRCYLYTLDSHDCFGAFACEADAHDWARQWGVGSYQLLKAPPYETTLVRPPMYTETDFNHN